MLPRASILLLALMSLPVLAPPAQAQTPLPLIDAGKLTWGASVTFPPFESLADGKPVGFDVDMVEALSAKMKVQPSMTTMEFKGLIPALLGGRIDAIVSGMYINPERSQVVDFIPYLRIGDQMLVVVPTAGGVQDAYRSTEALRRLGLRHQLRYIVNRSGPETDLSEPMADLGGQVIGDIPDDESVVNAENAHRLVSLDESAPAAIALRRLARRVGSELRA